MLPFPNTLRSALILLLIETGLSWDYSWPESWARRWPNIWQYTFSENCKTSHMTAFKTVKTPISLSTSPLDHFDGPKVSPLNKTAGDQWEFDAVSADGTMAIVFGFYRDPNYDILGAGSFRVSTELVFENGTRYAQVDYPTDSIVEECEGSIKGLWRSNDFSYAFEISRSMRLAKIEVDTPPMKGTFTLKSFTPPRYPDGSVYPSANATITAAPYFYWAEPIPCGHAETDLTIKDTPFVFSGIGGHERLWVAFSWFTLLEGMKVVRAVLGPYSLTYVAFTSHIKRGVEYPSVFLVENEKRVFSSTRGEVSQMEDYVKYTKTYGGAVTGSLADRATGVELELGSPTTGKYWKFSLEHKQVGFEFPLGEGTGGTGFVAIANGGETGGPQYKGVALTEMLTFPKYSPLFKSQYSE